MTRDLIPDPGGPRHLLVVGVLGPELAAGGLPAQVEVGQPVQEAHPPGRRVADPGHGGPAARARGRRGAPWLAWGAGIRGPPTPAWPPASPARSWVRPGPARPGSARLGCARLRSAARARRLFVRRRCHRRRRLRAPPPTARRPAPAPPLAGRPPAPPPAPPARAPRPSLLPPCHWHAGRGSAH